MFHARSVEIGVGLFVVLGLAALFMLAMKVSNLATFSGDGGYDVIARFDNIGGLKLRSPVTMAGVRIGRVKAIGFDEETYQAKVTLDIDRRYRHMPADTSASIYTAGLLGEQYVALEPGGDERYLRHGSEIRLTESALVLERVVGQFLFSQGMKSPGEDADVDGGAGTWSQPPGPVDNEGG